MKTNIFTRAYEMPVSEKDLKELDGIVFIYSNNNLFIIFIIISWYNITIFY